MDKKHRTGHIASETGTIIKSWADRLSIAMIYPNSYGAGMSNLGFLSVYKILNNFENIVCERMFLPENGEALRSVESERRPDEFDIIAFSISFESDYPNMLSIIRSSGFPLQSNARGGSHPLLIAGGVACILNPEPIAEFIDCFLIGEGETLFDPFLDQLDFSLEKEKLLLNIAKNVPGAYVPRFYKAEYSEDNRLSYFRPLCGVPEKVHRVYLKDLSKVPTFSPVVTPEAAFDASWLIEISRGCPHGCRFCSAGFIYRPPRFRDIGFLTKCIEEGRQVSDKIGLVGTAISDHPDIGRMCSGFENDTLRFSFSSLRADGLSNDHIEAMIKSGVKTATIAPDAGSERMRKVINKGISASDVFSATEKLVSAGIPNLKVYFMVGLPGETDSDIQETISFCEDIKSVFLEASRPKGRIGTITISINPFVPKPFTPFQWAAMDRLSALKKKINTIKNGLRRVPNMTINAESPKSSVFQALLARGDRRISALIESLSNGKDGWNDILKTEKNIIERTIHIERSFSELFPWDFMDHGIKKSFLENEYRRALQGKTSPPCPIRACTKCGVCS